MFNVIVPTAHDVEPLVKEATSDQSAEVFVEHYLANLVELLKSNPRSYRAYGGYWWPLKRCLIERLVTDFGDNVEAVTVDRFFIKDEAHTIAAAWAYQNYQFEQGNQTSPYHLMPVHDAEDYEYILVDENMEMLIIQQD